MSDYDSSFYIQDRDVGDARLIGGCLPGDSNLRLALNSSDIIGLITVDIGHYNATQIKIYYEGQIKALKQYTDESYVTPDLPWDFEVVNEGGYAKCEFYWQDEPIPDYAEIQRSATSSNSNFSTIGIGYVGLMGGELLDNVLFSENRWYKVRGINSTGAGPWSDAWQAI